MQGNILLLQGPMGPFFKRFSKDLKNLGLNVHKINFNAGDWFFYRGTDSTNYTGSLEDWPDFIEKQLKQKAINAIYLFGDMRKYHQIAIDIARKNNIRIFVFEEGYLRPHYITLEENGVNGNSSVPNDADFYQNITTKPEKPPLAVPSPFYNTAWFAIIYYFFGWVGKRLYPYYQHHRSFNPFYEAYAWVRAAYRKYYYQYKERGLINKLTTQYSQQYFLVPLQVHNDAQIKQWSNISSVSAFIKKIIVSFAKNTNENTVLVIKHHPLDRGYSDYTALIKKLTKRHQCCKRVFYVHDLPLPSLLDRAKGTILLNSTVGLSSLLHRTPVITLGHAIYEIPGLTFQGQLNEFWHSTEKIDLTLNKKFRKYLLIKNQINGNFYRRIPQNSNYCGMKINKSLKSQLSKLRGNSAHEANINVVTLNQISEKLPHQTNHGVELVSIVAIQTTTKLLVTDKSSHNI